MTISIWTTEFWTRCFLPFLLRAPQPRLVWPCLEWVGLRGQGGYGVLALPDGLVPTHWYALRFVGVDPGDYMILHACDNPPCCNPWHMRLGTAEDNRRDREEHGAVRGSLAKAWAPFAPNYIGNRFQRKPSLWMRPLPMVA